MKGIMLLIMSLDDVRYPNLKEEHVTCRRRRLPHWDASGCAYFVTFRTADSISRDEAGEIRRLREELRLSTAKGLATHREAQRKLFRYQESRLDLGSGTRPFQDPSIARLMEEVLQHLNQAHYRLGTWCVMPNHVHVVVAPLEDRQLSKIVQAWKSVSSRRINQALGTSGKFWQEECFDHLIRSPSEHERFDRYIVDNPSKAGLVDWHSVSQLGQTTI